MTYNKTQLIKDCIKGRRKSCSIFYDLYKSKIFGISLRYSKDHDDAKDILQESFIRIFDQLKNVRNLEALDGWLRRVVVNTAINYYKRHIKTRINDDVNDLEVQNEDYSKILSEISNEELMICINSLPDGYRIVFNMYVIDGYKHKEIADLLGISENTSKSQLRAAKAQLRGKLDKIGITKYERTF